LTRAEAKPFACTNARAVSAFGTIKAAACAIESAKYYLDRAGLSLVSPSPRRGVWAVSRDGDGRLQKSPSRVFGQNSGNSADISKAFFEMGISKFESSQVSQAVYQPEIVLAYIAERPANCGLLQIGAPSLSSKFQQS
jgi:hypothetical protein